jgi:hypothetical protein|nr:MAG TPA: hypothetical protein [Caudoviricetes sp.]
MMGRLTKRAGGTVVYAGRYKQYEGGDIPAEVSTQGVRELLVRLAEYEDTGLGPEQCENAKAIIESVFSDDTSKAERIWELLKADRDGRLVVLPCEVGSIVYTEFCDEIVEKRIGQFHVNGYTEPRLWADIDCDWTSTQCVRWDLAIGKTIFLTREEAEAALKEVQKGD